MQNGKTSNTRQSDTQQSGPRQSDSQQSGPQQSGSRQTGPRQAIEQHYSEVANNAAAGCCDLTTGEAIGLYSGSDLKGIPAEALAASRGCGDPVAKAALQPGERVLDLGSGGGIDALIAARAVGAQGRVYGLDMTAAMVELARRNAAASGIRNVEFLEGSIENIPLPDASVDVVISNCVINFCENKTAVFAEARRVLAPKGRIVVSDIVAFKPVPPAARDALCEVTGCRNGITDVRDYERMLHECGFARVSIEQKTLYTNEILHEKARRKGRIPAYETAAAAGADATCGSAIITAFATR